MTPPVIPGRSWTVFLDRDGVVNRRIDGGYVRTWAEFEFLPGALDAITRLAAAGPRILVVTNQAGVGRGVMPANALDDIHRRMLDSVAAHGGRIDGVFACPHAPVDRCDCRKPAIGLGTQARRAYPDLDPARAVVIGDSASDMGFAHGLGMRAVLVDDTDDPPAVVDPPPDAVVADLATACDLVCTRWLGVGRVTPR